MWGSLAAANPYRYSSKEQDPRSGLYYYGYRWYAPNLQRWVNRDPIEEVGGINLYEYARNRPINIIDSFGLFGNDPYSLPPQNGTQVNSVPVENINTPALPCNGGGSLKVSNNDSQKELGILIGVGAPAVGAAALIVGLAGPDEVAITSLADDAAFQELLQARDFWGTAVSSAQDTLASANEAYGEALENLQYVSGTAESDSVLSENAVSELKDAQASFSQAQNALNEAEEHFRMQTVQF
jgi:RHS repeat-associated protein